MSYVDLELWIGKTVKIARGTKLLTNIIEKKPEKGEIKTVKYQVQIVPMAGIALLTPEYPTKSEAEAVELEIWKAMEN
jgi:hypothetical protein